MADQEEIKNVLPREFDLIAKQMELQDTSSGCWSGGSTIQGKFCLDLNSSGSSDYFDGARSFARH